jgi:ADP-ribose pyrophosphatase YjhB (NUDIX family)
MARASKISIKDAKKNKLFYFVANVVIYRAKDKRCLILKRHKREIVHPGKYAVPGGKLEWEDLDLKNPTRYNGDVLDFEDMIAKLLVREAKEEAGVNIEKEIYFINDVTFVRPDGIPVVLVKFAAKYKSGKVKPEKGTFTDYAWVNEKEVKNYPCIKGIAQEVKKTIEIFKKL